MLLRHGSRGSNVRELQRMLTAAGFRVPQTGVYGDITEKAVRAYQRANGLAVDGVAGSQTMGALAPPVPRPNPAREPAAVPVQMAGGAPQGAQALVDMFATPAETPVAAAPAPGIGSDPDRSMGAFPSDGGLQDRMVQGLLDASRVNMDYRALRMGLPPPYNTGARLPPNQAQTMGANSPFADPTVQSYTPGLAAMFRRP